MPRRKKRDWELTDEEVAKKLFPKKVRDELKRIAHEKDDDQRKSSSQEDSNKK
jgi:hypothetical protein